MVEVENPMVVDWWWKDLEKPLDDDMTASDEEFDGEEAHGYQEIGTSTFIDEEDAFDYALEQCLHGEKETQAEFREMLVDWFYGNGDWRKK